MIYLDNAATTKPNKVFIDAYNNASINYFYNASAIYNLGIHSSKIIENVKSEICKLLGTTYKNNVIFTGGATEANNLAIIGSYRSNWKEVMLSEGEHPSVYNLKDWLESKGVKVILIPLLSNGSIDYDFIEKNISDVTNLVSVMIVNNETGAINDIITLKNIIKNNSKAMLHCDGVQAFGKLDLTEIGKYCDMMTISAHKMGGCKGLGALYVKNPHLLKPVLLGGGQEFGLRSGTENVPAIYALGELIKQLNLKQSLIYIKNLKNAFLKTLCESKTQFICNSSEEASPYILSLSFPKVNGETLARILEEKGVIVSTGSACSSKKKGNRTLSSMGIKSENVLSSIRVSFFMDNSMEDVVNAAKIISRTYEDLKERIGAK